MASVNKLISILFFFPLNFCYNQNTASIYFGANGNIFINSKFRASRRILAQHIFKRRAWSKAPYKVIFPLFQQVWSQLLSLGVNSRKEGNLPLRVPSVFKPALEGLSLGFKVNNTLNGTFSPWYPRAGLCAGHEQQAERRGNSWQSWCLVMTGLAQDWTTDPEENNLFFTSIFPAWPTSSVTSLWSFSLPCFYFSFSSACLSSIFFFFGTNELNSPNSSALLSDIALLENLGIISEVSLYTFLFLYFHHPGIITQ